VWGCRLAGKNHDRVISESLRGFAGDDFFRSIRQQPAVPLLALLARRLEQFDWKTVDRRAERGETAIRLMPLVPRPGRRAEAATHWVFPILCDHPDELALALSAHGFDATRGGSSMTVIPPPPGNSSRRAFRAEETLAQILYLPVYPGVSDKELARLARLIDAATGASAQRIGPELQLSEPS
jgi:dTDP-4-amino-4,6-dideoxygalactose transaminase